MQKHNYPRDFNDAVKFHGHACPGLAIGYRAAKIAINELQAQRPEDEEVVTVVENDACGVDAIQFLLGCTFGKGNLVFHDYGKQVFTVFSRTKNKGVRIALKPNALEPDDARGRELFEKVRENRATQAELDEHHRRRRERIQALIERPADTLFDIREVDAPPPAPARIFNSILCEQCGEKVMEKRTRMRDGKTICIPCAE